MKTVRGILPRLVFCGKFNIQIKVFACRLKFSPAFFKRRRSQERVALVALRRARKFYHGVFFLIAFSFAPVYAKEKADGAKIFYSGCLLYSGFCL